MSNAGIIEPPHLAGDLKRLKLPAMAVHWKRLADEARRARQTHADYLADLAHAEVLQRRERRIQRRIQDARFPVLKTLDGFDFKAQPGLDRDTVLDLFRCAFVEEHSNVVLVGAVGTGKTHLAIALGIACCQREHRVRFVSAAELTNELVEAKSDGRLSRKLEQLARLDVVVLDELGYVPFDKLGADLLFGFITKVYERRSLVVTTNLPFAKWSEVFLDATAAAAVIDRIVHHAVVLKTEGSSFRLRDAKARGAKKEVTERPS
jgi:DNA replication protein DnaC